MEHAAERAHGRDFVIPAGYGWFMLAVVSAVVWVLIGSPQNPHRTGLWCTFLAVAAVACYLTQRRIVNGRWIAEPPTLLILVMLMWHFSFWIVYYLGWSSAYRKAYYLGFAPFGTGAAFLASLVGLLALIAGVQAGIGRTVWSTNRIPRALSPKLYPIAILGALLVVAYFVVKGHTDVGTYEQQWSSEDSLRRLYNLGVIFVLGASGPILLCEQNRKRRRLFLLLILLPTLVISLALGTRWILFSAALIALAAHTMRERRGGLLRFVLLGICLILVGTVVKEYRAGHVHSFTDAKSALLLRHSNPVREFFEEIGQAFPPVAGVIQQHNNENARRLYGSSFAGSAITVIPDVENVTGYQARHPDSDLAARFVGDKYRAYGYTIGYSIVAELYLNFGVIGIVLGMLLLGYLVGYLYRRSVTREGSNAMYVLWVVVAFMMYGIRNDTFTWTRYAVWGAIAFWIVGRAARYRSQ